MSKVELLNKTVRKPYLGGWRHRITGVEYFNAASQTGPPPKRVAWNQTCSRQVQVVGTDVKSLQTVCASSTQMWRTDCYIPSCTDKFLTVKYYQSYDEIFEILDRCARIIQRNYKAYRLRKCIKECAGEYRRMLQECTLYEKEKKDLLRQRRHRDIINQIHPKTRQDFDLLYEMVENWRHEQYNKLQEQGKSYQCSANYNIIVDKTARLLNDIGKLKQRVKSDFMKRKRLNVLTMNCQPVRWNGYKGKIIEMITLRTQLALEYKALYEGLEKKFATSKERIEVLCSIKNSLQIHNCVTVNNLMYLLDQEIMLLYAGIETVHLTFLRKRIKSAFLNFVNERNTCECAVRSKFEELHEPRETRSLACSGCAKLLPPCSFVLHSRTRKMSLCKSCTWLKQRNIAHINHCPYMFMLNEIRAEEQSRNNCSPFLYFLNQADIYYLVNIIWHGHSVISENDNLYTLRLVRFNMCEEWTPWNCVLLTEDEADVHRSIKNHKTFYSTYVLRKIMLANVTAKRAFENLVQLSRLKNVQLQ